MLTDECERLGSLHRAEPSRKGDVALDGGALLRLRHSSPCRLLLRGATRRRRVGGGLLGLTLEAGAQRSHQIDHARRLLFGIANGFDHTAGLLLAEKLDDRLLVVVLE